MRSILLKALAALIVLVLALVAFFAWTQYSNSSDLPSDATAGKDPTLVDPDPQTIPSMKLVDPVGWAEGEAPTPAKGLVVTRFAQGLQHPRTMLTLPNGDVLVTETGAPKASESGGLTGMVMGWAMGKVGAGAPSADTIKLLRDSNGDGKADQTFDLRKADLVSPSGMAYREGKLYVANHDAILEFAFTPGDTKIEGTPKKLMDLWPGGNHWMRNLLLSEDGKALYVAVGSATNIADNGMEEEAGRAAIWEIDTETGRRRQFAAGMRNPNGLDWNPATGEMWATVQERDMLGPDLVPDYFTNVPVGAQYGWPWVYWKNIFDERVQYDMQTYMIEYTRKPEYAMGAHTGTLGMVFDKGGTKLGKAFQNGAFIARHGSWNRRPAVGYDVVFIPFDANGNPRDVKPQRVLTGFLEEDGSTTHGRPTWVAFDASGALLVTDDTAGIIWRVVAPDADASPEIAPIVTDHLEPKPGLVDPNSPEAAQKRLQAGFRGTDRILNREKD
ncbi:PQQ-dependent sugar dehydrogenase [Novosphingobium mangrovi (ex Hu et al. 2023)]|uniref:Sorbosone dehydrogenase family protein n=1 Tax=Novosphingobium mangrovi (ex Hu et al. 2023) TaxID=2930094 RepID=A0ABT0AAZ7_9SPHN|nr:sorbosone dehydrogenase family protein [Novosphingobium mangrovi (ex Hu et al. 2023)]MCJ1960362.1 sorbosone dehydrogenase family protein [Novosphingobium mangrovi (ex Hu et al. 2023)]